MKATIELLATRGKFSIAPSKNKQIIMLTKPVMLQVMGHLAMVPPTMWVTSIQQQSHLPSLKLLRVVGHSSQPKPSLRSHGQLEVS